MRMLFTIPGKLRRVPPLRLALAAAATMTAVLAVNASSDNCVNAFNLQRYHEALTACQERAGRGDPEAMYLLGVMRADGLGAAANPAQAVEWFTMAAEKDHAAAQSRLADAYYSGEGAPQSYSDAAWWYEPAAQKGDAHAQAQLGGMYEYGFGVSFSYEEALAWYQKSAAQGYAAGQYGLGVMFDEGRGAPEDNHQAAEWYAKASDQGFIAATLALAEMYLRGDGVARDMDKAAHYFQQAAGWGHRDAQFALGQLYETGKKDHAQAFMWYTLAAERGSAAAAAAVTSLEPELSLTQKNLARKMAREWRPTER